MDDGLDGAAFLASSILGAKGVTAAAGAGLKGLGKVTGVGAKVNSALANAAKAENSFYKTMKALDDTMGAGWQSRSAKTLYSTLSEAGTEAKGTFEDIKADLELKKKLADQGNEQYKQFKDMTPEEIKRRASEAAAATFKWNSLVLLAPNWMESG